MTPTTVNGRPSSVIVRPESEGSLRNCCRHKRALTTATSCGSVLSNVRPISGFAPSSVKNSRSATTAVTRSGPEGPVMCLVATSNPLNPTKEVLSV